MRPKILKIVLSLLGIAVLGVVAWFVLLWVMFVGTDSGRREASLERLRDRGYLPPEARIVLANDTHGGFHGDGTTFIVFECSHKCLATVRAEIDKDHDYRLKVNPQEGWQRSSHDDAFQRTLEMTFPENDDRSVLPDIDSKGMEFRCIGQITKPFSYCTTLYVIDHLLDRFWYMNITT